MSTTLPFKLTRIRSAIYEWRASPQAILLPAFLQALTIGLSELPLVYLFRTIRCEQYEASLPHTPGMDVCRSPIVQKAYTADVAMFTTVATVMGIVLSGPYGALSDLKGRKRTLIIASSLNGLGVAWLIVCMYYASFLQPWVFQLSAVIQGLGGGFSVIISAQNAFIADTTSPIERSRYLGLSLVMLWTGGAVGPLISAPLTNHKLYALNFGVMALAWVVYVLYVAFFVRETRLPSGERDSGSVLSVLSGSSIGNSHEKTVVGLMLQVFVEPLRVIAVNRAILLPSIAVLGAILSAGAFSYVVPYCDSKFGLSPNEAGVIAAVLSISRAIAVVAFLPMVLAAFKYLSRRNESVAQNDTPGAQVDEQTPLLSEEDREAEAAIQSNEDEVDIISDTKVDEASATRELVIARVGLIIEALGVLALWESWNALEINIATTIGSLGAPSSASLLALVTMGAPPDETGRVLAGLSILESLAVALRNPVFFPLFQATLEKMPGAIWWLAALIYVLSSILMLFVHPKQYVH